jgi:cytochrome P450
MTDRQLRDQVVTFLGAGHETTAVTLSWTWGLLSQHPEVRDKLHAEIEAVLGGRPPAFEDLPRLQYTGMVIQEALRLYPPAPFLSRRTIDADEVDGYHIPANSLVLVGQYVTHRHPEFWHDPEKFDPERFTPEQSKARPKYAYFPFSGGPRKCIGDQFAMMEAKLIVAAVAQKLQLDLAPGHKPEPVVLFTLRPKEGMMMTIRGRK